MNALILCASAFVFSCGTYLVWPSRWNIPAHMQLGFWFVSSVAPLYLAHVLRHSNGSAFIPEYEHVMFMGAVAYGTCMVVGAAIRARGRRLNLLERVALSGYETDDSVTKRTQVAVAVALALLGYSMLRMGFIPMFAADPIMAKFFRGAYATRYAPVATYFRLGMSLLSVLMPALCAYAVVSSKKTLWRALAAAGLLAMLITLQRGPAVSGVVLFLGVWMVRRRKTGLFVAIAVGTYIGGTLFYVALNRLGIFTDSTTAAAPFWSTVAASAPDVTDALSFLSRWHQAGDPLTHGRTFYGGLIPSHYAWNPAVWGLTVGNPNIDVNNIGSGGLRIPAPIWGMVSLGGSLGVCVVSGISGFMSGWLARAAREGMAAARTLMSQVWVVMLYSAMTTVFVGFYSVNYIAAIQLLIVYAILRKGLQLTKHDREGISRPQVIRRPYAVHARPSATARLARRSAALPTRSRTFTRSR